MLILEPDADVGYFGRTVEFPTVMADGRTVAACVAEVLEATTLAVATMLERGEQPPAPASEGKRDQQVNLRISASERMRLEQIAHRDGYRSISEYIRDAALKRSA